MVSKETLVAWIEGSLAKQNQTVQEAAEAYARTTPARSRPFQMDYEGFLAGRAWTLKHDPAVLALVEELGNAKLMLSSVLKNCQRLDGLDMRDYGKFITALENTLDAFHKERETTHKPPEDWEW